MQRFQIGISSRAHCFPLWVTGWHLYHELRLQSRRPPRRQWTYRPTYIDEDRGVACWPKLDNVLICRGAVLVCADMLILFTNYPYILLGEGRVPILKTTRQV